MRKFLLGFVVGILALPVVALAGAWLGLLPTNANATPSRLEKAFAHLALDAAAARRAPRESHSAHGRKLDGWNETFQERLCGLPR